MKKSNITIYSFILWIYTLSTSFIFIYMIYNSFRSKKDFLGNTLGVPQQLGVENYIKLFVQEKFYLNVISSIIILILTLFLLMTFSTMVAYGIGRYVFRFKNVIRIYFLLGLMFPTQLGIIPVFIIIRNLGLMNTYWGVVLVLSSMISLPVLLLSTFFKNVSESISDAAKVDGASEFKIFLKIMLPLASPVIFTLCIIMSLQIWNQFFIPLIFLQDDSIKTIPLAIMRYTSTLYSFDLALAGSVIASIPLLIVFFIFSQRIIENVTAGGVKL